VRYYAGIDGGQSSTLAAIGDESGRVLGRGRAGAADEVGQDARSTRLRDALHDALHDAIARAHLPAEVRFTRIVAGISGYEGRVYGQPPDLPADTLTLEHDTAIAHAGALGGEAGIVIIAGTGSVAYGVNAAGESALIGGWGYLFGDEGSAFWLARDVVSSAMRDADAGQPNDLAQLALRHFNVASLRKLSRAFYAGEISRAQLASFGSVVLEQAEKGSPEAAPHVERGAQALAQLAMHAADRLGLEAPNVALVGGMFRNRMMRESTVEGISRLMPRARCVSPRYDPPEGALLLAYKADGILPQSLSG
jgi:N-acetylglucosamine kinase-like BadF-type ATPase